MGLFNRYEYHQGIESAFWEGNDLYCNPADYSVSEDECQQYLKGIETGNKLNDEWNDKRESRWVWSSVIIGGIATISIPPLVFLWLDSNDSAWGLPACILSSWIVIGISIVVCNKVDEYFQNNKIFLARFYPEINENIERLFDDYLWKSKLLKEAGEKGEEQKRTVREGLVRKSHPGLDEFIKVVEEELNNPSEDCVFGDVKFGMTPEEMYKTKVFKGLTLKKDIYLGYRGSYLGSYFAMSSNFTSFQLKDNLLSSAMLSSSVSYGREEIVERFISCCEKLNSFYGNPTNLQERYLEKGYELFSNHEAIFQVGKKKVILTIVKAEHSTHDYKIEILFSTTEEESSKKNPQQPFNNNWFNSVRKLYSPPKHVPIPDNYLPF